MRKPRIYLETTMFNFYFADDAPEKRHDTLKLFEEIGQGKFEPYTSQYVIQELELALETKKSMMFDLVKRFGVQVFPASIKAERLAEIYVKESIIPIKYTTDDLHLAITAVMDLDFIVSLNFKHIVKRKTIEMTEVVNYREGYRKVGIYPAASRELLKL